MSVIKKSFRKKMLYKNYYKKQPHRHGWPPGPVEQSVLPPLCIPGPTCTPPVPLAGGREELHDWPLSLPKRRGGSGVYPGPGSSPPSPWPGSSTPSSSPGSSTTSPGPGSGPGFSPF